MSIRYDKDLRYRKSRGRKARPKTFKSEEAAKKHAEEKGYKNYKLEHLKSTESKTKKIRVVNNS